MFKQKFSTGDTVCIVERDESGIPLDVSSYIFLAYADTAVIVSSFISGCDFLEDTLKYHIHRTARDYSTNLFVFPAPDCYSSDEEAKDALRREEAQLS